MRRRFAQVDVLPRADLHAVRGAALRGAGVIHVDGDADGTLWIGGDTITCLEGTVEL